jgi:hypothetical protein
VSTAERLMALFVAPPGESPAPAAAASGRAERSPGGDGAPESVPERSTTQSGGPRLRVVPVFDDGGAEASGEGASERHPAASLAERHPAAPLAGGLAASLDACGLRVCVLGGGGRAGSAFASALAARLARLPGARCAVVCAAPLASVAAPGRPPELPGPSAPAARRVARGLAVDGYEASVRGRVVEVASSDAPESVVAALAAARGRAPGAPTLTLLPGTRRSALDAVVGRQDLVLVIVDADASSSLSALAVAELSRVAPGAVVRAVPLPRRLGAAARRAAVTRALETLR